MAISTEENWKIIKNKKIWGVKDRQIKQLKDILIGDRVYFYQSKNRKRKDSVSSIIGLGCIASEQYRDETQIFDINHALKMGELFPNRVKLNDVEFIESIPFSPLIKNLNFIKNKSNWSFNLLGKAMIELDEHDQKVIQEAINELPHSKGVQYPYEGLNGKPI